MSRLDAGKYSRNIKNFTFREEGALTIPELSILGSLGRKTCYHLAIDVIIESITRIPYKNYRVKPATSFYGYATLVEQDCLLPPIELTFGRQRIYEKTITEAFQCWNNLAFWDNTEKRFAELMARLISGNTSIINVCDVDSYPFDFEDISLREIYIKCNPQTQFKVELYWVSPIPFTDDCGKLQDGKSKKEDDPKKDKGLPPNGSNPKQNSPSSPYSGNLPENNPPPDSPYRNNKKNNLDNPDPDNTDPNLKYWLEFRAPRTAASFTPRCSTKYSLIIIPIPSPDTGYDQTFEKKGTDSCSNNDYGVYTFKNSQTQQVLGDAGFLEAFGGVITYNSGSAYPAPIYYSDTPV